jgi:hypothetical protein
MTTEPVRFDVYTLADCPASAATIALLDELGANYEVRDFNRQRAWLAHQKYHVSPAVCVYMGTGQHCRRWTSWQGHRADMIRLALEMGAKDDRAAQN